MHLHCDLYFNQLNGAKEVKGLRWGWMFDSHTIHDMQIAVEI
jgi:hypothetical protein